MDVNEYLAATGMSQNMFATLCKISANTANRLVHGAIPKLKVAKRIQAKTKHVITIEELLNPKKKNATNSSHNRRRSNSMGSSKNIKKKKLRYPIKRKKNNNHKDAPTESIFQ